MVRNKLCKRLLLTTCTVFYEFAGTIGPIAAVKLIDSVGENLSFFLSPVSLALAGIVWFCIHPTENEHDPALPEDHRTESEHDPALPEDPAVEMAIPQAPVQEPGYLTRYRNASYLNPRRR